MTKSLRSPLLRMAGLSLDNPLRPWATPTYPFHSPFSSQSHCRPASTLVRVGLCKSTTTPPVRLTICLRSTRVLALSMPC
ncbi:hypothetical protein D9M71_840200 [compost metagenome]